MNTMKWLKTQGPAIVTEDGEQIRLRGVGVGGWLNMENFITGYPYTESSHRAAMHRVLGQRRYDLFFDSFLTHFFGSEDAAFIASLGLNCVRIPVNWHHWPDGFRHVDRAIDACAAAGLYTVIDLHAAPGYQNHHWHSDNPFTSRSSFPTPFFPNGPSASGPTSPLATRAAPKSRATTSSTSPLTRRTWHSWISTVARWTRSGPWTVVPRREPLCARVPRLWRAIRERRVRDPPVPRARRRRRWPVPGRGGPGGGGCLPTRSRSMKRRKLDGPFGHTRTLGCKDW